MPPRLATATIIVFWLATTGVLVYRELAPRFQAGEAPPFTIPLTAEVGNNIVNWNVFQKDLEIGSGETRIQRQPDRTFELSAKFKLNQITILKEFEKVRVVGAYRVTEDGKLLAGTANIYLPEFDAEIALEGQVRNGQFHPKLAVLVGGRDINPFPPPVPFPVSESGSILNPMHLVHKISGLRAGQSWTIPLMDPLRAAPAVKGLVSGKTSIIGDVVATVTTEDREWHKQSTPCFKIEYAKPGERPLAATWVRRRDDAVLEQWASYEGAEYTLRRAPGQ